jgi:carbamoyl-phosphate synthase small subunit
LRKLALLALEDGSLFRGESIGADGHAQGEVVFNTSITGYQEILTDPSYCRQIITLTYPHIGSVGTNRGDEEATRIFASGLVVRDCPRVASNWRSQQPLEHYLRERGVIAIAGIDTRRLTRLLREKGALNGCLMAGDHPDAEQALKLAREFPGLKGMDLARVVSVSMPYEWNEGTWQLASNSFPTVNESRYHVVAYDYGIKRNILRMLADCGCGLNVVPA